MAPPVAAVLLLAALTACGGSKSPRNKSAEEKPSTTPAVDCSDQSLSQAEWMKHCSDKADTGGDGGKATGLVFGESYMWPDGVKATVVEAKVFSDYDAENLESAEPGDTDFRIKLKVTNGGKVPFDLGDVSIIVEGATNGGEAATTVFERGSEPLEGRLGLGVTATKTDDNVLETKYGRKVIVTVQRSSDDFGFDFPEFNGSIAD
ncbi:hypothetical protein ACFYRC_26295 [Streptomyces sp. NPDC005279]|uniref:hypothetical protein n=1 Tax=Streptomyces sp. NPDC005279 TaxID=3364712 RepID=UPI0036897404